MITAMHGVSTDFKPRGYDIKITKQILRLENKPEVFDYFVKKQAKLSGYGYWYLLGTLWVANPLGVHIDRWRELFENPARKLKRTSLMKPNEYQAWLDLPEIIEAYRAVSALDHRPLSYTTSAYIAERHARHGRRQVERFTIPKVFVLAYFLRRNEFELLVTRWPAT